MSTAKRPCQFATLYERLRPSRQKFANHSRPYAHAIQEWERGWRVPDRVARVLLTVIDRDPEAVAKALGESGAGGPKVGSVASRATRWPHANATIVW